MKAKRFTAIVLAMSFSMAPTVLLANNNTPNNNTKYHSKPDTYNKHMNEMKASKSYEKHNKNFDKKVVSDVQKKLNDGNFYLGSVDGIYGPKTRAAIMDYQRSEDLEVTGRLNQETLDSLNIDSTYFGTERNMYSE